jgi:hypothetical protein
MSKMTTNFAGELVHPWDFVQRRRWSGADGRPPTDAS